MQEYTRLATSLCRESVIADESGELRIAATAIVSALADKLDEILAVENESLPPELAKRWHKALALVSHGPPDLEKGYYYFGLLDCISQLAAVSDSQILGGGLLIRVKNLVFDSIVPEFRWKAVSISSSRGEACPEDPCQFSTNTDHRSKSFYPVIALAGNSIMR